MQSGKAFLLRKSFKAPRQSFSVNDRKLEALIKATTNDMQMC